MAINHESALFEIFFEEFYQNLLLAKATKKYYKIGRFTLEVCYYQKNILFFEQSIAHLEISAISVDFNIVVVSENDTNVTPPNAFWCKESISVDGFIMSDDGKFIANYNQVYNFFQIADCVKKRAFYWMHHEEKLPEWERSFSFRNILHYFTENTNYCMLHAAGLGTNKGGIILPGKGGSGKSNTSLACVGSNIQYLGDDFLLVDIDTLTAFSLYNIAKLEQHRLQHFHVFKSIITSNKQLSNGKIPFFLFPTLKNYIIKSFPIKYIFLPQFSGLLDTSIENSSSAESLKAMAPSTLGLLKASQSTFKKMVLISQRLPTIILRTGTDLQQIPKIIAKVLNES